MLTAILQGLREIGRGAGRLDGGAQRGGLLAGGLQQEVGSS